MVRAILNFHGIGTPSRPLSAAEASFWLDLTAFRNVLDRVAALPADRRPMLTFDDGNASDMNHAAPELARRGLTARFFLLSSRLDQPYFLTSGQVADLVAAGHSIGLHGADHVDWRGLDAAGRHREFVVAREALEDASGTFVDTAAIPFGRYDRHVLRHLRAAGFSGVYTSDKGAARPGAWLRPRNCLQRAMDTRAVEGCLTGQIPWPRKPRRWIGLVRKRVLPILTA